MKIIVSRNGNYYSCLISPETQLEAVIQLACTNWQLDRVDWEFKLSLYMGEHTLKDGNTDTPISLGFDERCVQMYINCSERS
jgi:hypothetical protein